METNTKSELEGISTKELVEELKRRVPIWKRERYSDGSEAWVEPGEQQ